MSSLALRNISKIYPNNNCVVKNFNLEITAITVAIGCPETLAMVRHLGSFGMSCHNLSQALAILTSSDTELYPRTSGRNPA